MIEFLIGVYISMSGEVYIPRPQPEKPVVKTVRENNPAVKKNKAPQEAPPKNLEYNTDIYEITAYTAGYESTGKGPEHPEYGVTASGATAQEGVTVACPPELEFGTVVEIEGVGKRTCQDRGGAIKGKRLDLFIADLQRALEFGRRRLKVIIYD